MWSNLRKRRIETEEAAKESRKNCGPVSAAAQCAQAAQEDRAGPERRCALSTDMEVL